jgi:hypothetical protein
VGTTISNIFDINKGAVIGNYNPLPILTFAIEKALTGGDFDEDFVRLVHTDNLLLHLLTVFLVMRFMLVLGFGNWALFWEGFCLVFTPCVWNRLPGLPSAKTCFSPRFSSLRCCITSNGYGRE